MVLLSFSVTSCSEPPPLKIGFLGSMTGRGTDLCVSARDGVQLAIESVNQQGGVNGRQVELIIFDDQGDEAKVREGVNFLADSGVVAIVGPITSQMSVAALPTANERKLVLISPTTSTVDLSGIDDHFFRVYPTCEQNAHALADYAVKTSKTRRVAILVDLANASFTTSWQHCFKSRIIETGSEVITTISFNSRNKNLSFFTLAKKILEKQPDGILILTDSMNAAIFSQQISKLSDKHIDLYGSDWAFSGDLVQYGGNSVEGFTFTTNVDMESDAPAFKKFKKEFVQRFGKGPKFPSVLAYEATEVIFLALRQNPDTLNLAETLKKIGVVDGLQNSFQWDAFGDIKRPSYINQVKNGHFVNLGSKS